MGIYFFYKDIVRIERQVCENVLVMWKVYRMYNDKMRVVIIIGFQNMYFFCGFEVRGKWVKEDNVGGGLGRVRGFVFENQFFYLFVISIWTMKMERKIRKVQVVQYLKAGSVESRYWKGGVRGEIGVLVLFIILKVLILGQELVFQIY